MITSKEIKYYSSLLQKKYRQQEKKFIAEGDKLVREGIESGFIPEIIFTTNSFFEEQNDFFGSLADFRVEKIKAPELNKLTDTKTPQQVLAVFPFKETRSRLSQIKNNLVVYLDNISDPGNTGTILRNCDWFGIKDVILSEGSVELYNPKVVRSSMGSVFHLNIYEDVNINDLEQLKAKGYSIVSSDLSGEDLFDFNLSGKSIVIFSNEAHGPSNVIRELADYFISIPKKGEAESLNVASASAVILSHLTRTN
jgi:RNA methyltransferase, TrmH family